MPSGGFNEFVVTEADRVDAAVGDFLERLTAGSEPLDSADEAFVTVEVDKNFQIEFFADFGQIQCEQPFDDDELHFRSTIHVRYGEPFQIPKTDARNPSPAILKQVRQEMTKNVSALLTMDDFYGDHDEIEMKNTANSDEVKPEKIRTKQSADENLESEGKESIMSKQNKNEKNRAEKPETEKDILKEIEDEISADVDDIVEETETTTDKKHGRKAVEDVSDAIDELDEKEEKAAKRAASAMKASDSFKKRVKDAEIEDEMIFDEDDLFEDDKKKEKNPQQASAQNRHPHGTWKIPLNAARFPA